MPTLSTPSDARWLQESTPSSTARSSPKPESTLTTPSSPASWSPRPPVCPTLGFVPGAQPSPAVRALLRKAESTNQSRPQIVARLHHAGVRLVAGSDAGVSTTDVVASATSIAADAGGLTDRKGRLAPGLDADLLLLDGDPLADITSLRNVEAVYLRGRRVV
jgi:predicted amidohydrolase YtcJ